MSVVSKDRRDGSSDIKAVILDYGKVLARSPTVPEFGRMAEMFNVSFESFYQLWEATRDPYDRGDVSAEEYWLQLAAKTKTTLGPGQIETLRQVEVEIWAHADPDMLDWLSRLHAAGIKAGLLTNMPLDLRKHLLENFQWLENFDFKTFSAEVRLIKPDPAIFEHTIHGLGVAAAEALFVDDRERNIKAATELGIRGIQFRSVEQFKDELEALDFSVLPVVAEPSSRGSGIELSGQEIKFQL